MSVPDMPEARNIAEWAIDQARTVKIAGFESQLQTMDVTSRATGEAISIPVFRVYLSEFDGAPGRFEWNIASKQCMALIGDILKNVDYKSKKYKVTRQGAPPKTRWALEELK